MIKKLSHVSLLTNNFDKVYKFYVEILGLKVAHKFINNKFGPQTLQKRPHFPGSGSTFVKIHRSYFCTGEPPEAVGFYEFAQESTAHC